MEEYNERKPHEPLNNLTPVEWRNTTVNRKINQQKLYEERCLQLCLLEEGKQPV